MRARLVTAAIAAAMLPLTIVVVGAQAASAAKGNSGHLEISEVGVATPGNDPHVGCTFDVQWYGYQRSSATLTFESQAPTKTAVITKTAGPDKVPFDTAASGSTLNAVRTYTLKFTGADPQPQQGYKVKVSTDAAGANGATGKYKVFWVQCDRADVPVVITPGEGGGTNPGTDPGTNPGTTDPGTTDPGTNPGTTDPGTTDPGTNPGTTDPGTTDPGTDPGTTEPGTPEPFSWDWEYQDPTCAGVGVDYPSNIPDGQANDVNIRVETPAGTKTLNFHNNEGTWSGSHSFSLADHLQWDENTPSYDITWVQVGGTNYHWKGDVGCVLDNGVLKARTDLNGFNTATRTVSKGSAVGSDDVYVGGTGDQAVELQMYSTGSARGAFARSAGTWKTVKAVTVSDNGTARVTFPKLTKKGTYKFRLAVAGSATATGGTTGTLTVRVR